MQWSTGSNNCIMSLDSGTRRRRGPALQSMASGSLRRLWSIPKVARQKQSGIILINETLVSPCTRLDSGSSFPYDTIQLRTGVTFTIHVCIFVSRASGGHRWGRRKPRRGLNCQSHGFFRKYVITRAREVNVDANLHLDEVGRILELCELSSLKGSCKL